MSIIDLTNDSSPYNSEIALALEASRHASQPAPAPPAAPSAGDADVQKAAGGALRAAEPAPSKQEKSEQKEHEKPPIVSKITTVKEFARKTYKETDVARIGLEKLDTDFFFQKIVGDGHCFFRATATFLVKKWVTMSGMRRKEFLDLIHTNVDQVSSSPLQAKFKIFEKTLKALAMEECSYSNIVYNETKSNQLVSFLRQLACEYTRASAKENNSAIASIVASFPGEPNVEDYLDSMSDMQRARNADHLELLALSKMLGLNIRILDVLNIGTGGAILDDHHRIVYDETKPDDLFLIKRFSHYDLAVKKKVFT